MIDEIFQDPTFLIQLVLVIEPDLHQSVVERFPKFFRQIVWDAKREPAASTGRRSFQYCTLSGSQKPGVEQISERVWH
ncbi:hypothetical protein [Luteibacter sp. 9135]|uniref:hypothetical protein n=1 Tax=Luteibacter sp. 9135 TaxID=1500893 RepID=UPI001C84074F|nr:hypothetical protein [Luteibacter sp. 9135]